MGQQLFKVHLDIDNNTLVNSDTNTDKDDISFFFPSKSSDQQISNSQIEFAKQIRNNLFIQTKPTYWDDINNEINQILMNDVYTSITEQYKKIIEDIQNRLEYKQQLQISLIQKLENDNYTTQSIFSQPLNQSDQLSYFAIQSLLSILLILIKSAEKNDPVIIHQILILTSQLCDQLPMKSLSSTNTLLFKSLQPLLTYIHDLSLTTDPIISKQAIKILLSFSIVKGSFKDILFLLNKLIFNTIDTYNVQGLFIQLNNGLTKTMTDEIFSLDYLKSINSYPTTELIKLDEKIFTGQFLSSIILSHIDIENEINSPKLSSISTEFHSDTFKYLFNIIEQLTVSSELNKTMNQILTICLRLFTTHLQFLSDIKSDDQKNYVTDEESTKWFELLLKLASNENKQASKALIHVLNILKPSFSERLSLIHQYIIKDKHPILIKELFIELNKHEILLNWIEILCDEKTLNILYSFIDLYFNTKNEQIERLLLTFQQLLLSQLIDQCQKKTTELQLSSLITQYLVYIFKKVSIMNELFNSILIGLCLMTKTDEIFLYETIEPIFISILPLLTDYYLQNLDNQYTEFVTFLLGRITQVLIIASPQDPLEIKHLTKLKLPIFAGGCVTDKNDDLLNSNLAIYSQFQLPCNTQDDQEFLMSVYNNIDSGAELILKLKPFIKNKHRLLQKSIEQQANDACAALFAVYIKHYRRINVAKSELSRTDSTQPSNHLLSLFEYANRIQTLFATIKGQGGDCNELSNQIKMKTLFLLTSIKESNLIPILNEDIPSKKGFIYQRQQSRWSKAKAILKVLRNLFQACIRFKKLMYEKKAKYDYESLLNRTLENFIYGDFHKTINEDKQLEIDELNQCLYQQHKRALIRLITYRFIKIFIQKILNYNQYLIIYLPYLRKMDLDWSYLDNIQASNYQLREEISENYYSITQYPLLDKMIFYLLNLSYESNDLCHLYQHQLIERLFIKSSEDKIAFDWFRLFVLKLCENIEIEKLRNISNQVLYQIENLVFNSLILNELKEQNSLKEFSLACFNRNINQYLILLFRCVYFYKHVLLICANGDYLQKLIEIYHQTQSDVTRLLTIKLLRYLIPYISDESNECFIKNFLIEVLNSINESTTSAELIYMYRTIMSIDSSWQLIATEFVFDSIKSYLNLNSIETNDPNEMNRLLASLCILGGYIEPYRLGSIVKVEMDKKIMSDEPSFALIIEIDSETSYTIQYFQTNQIESISKDKLQVEIDVPPPNLLLLPIPNDSIIDLLGDFIQIDTSTSQSILLLQLKRRCISILYYLLNDKKLIEIFMNKPYASMIAKLCVLDKTYRQPTDLREFNKQHLEQYSLSLDTCERLKKIIEIENKESILSDDKWNMNEINCNQLIIDTLSTSVLKYNGWKPYVSNEEMDYFKQGRIGKEEISIVPIPRNIMKSEAIQECGIKHRFRGRIAPDYENANTYFPTFIIDNLQLSEGKWYYCVRLPVGGVIQMGWATNGFTPNSSCGVGDDKYSWSYDGSRGVLFNEEGYYGQFDDIRWKENDICGCGIEIDGKNTKIKYWLNGKFLGIAFSHGLEIPLSTTKCNLLPNGSSTTFFPSVTIQWPGDPNKSCEFIFSPEDMQDCPLPNGYKPILLPKSINIENSIVDYPFTAYLVGENSQDFFLTQQTKSVNNILRDFVNKHHLQTTFIVDDHHLIIPEDSNGLLLPIVNDEVTSLTISFDFQILSTDDKLDISLLKLDSTEITWKKPAERTQCVIIFLSRKRQIKVYMNDKCQTFTDAFQYETLKQPNIHILPGIQARIQNLAIWKYALSEEHIHRLFTYSLFYIAVDYQQLKEYRKQVNTISFSKNHQVFTNELLIPFDEPFTESNNEENNSTIELFGNKTYLILDKSIEKWSEYSLILDISIPHLPIINEKLTLIILNPKSEIYITHEGKLCLESNDITHQSQSTIIQNEYFRLFISVQPESVQIYINDKSAVDIKTNNNQLQITSNRIELFKENDLTQNSTSEDTLRVSFKSITYLNQSISIDQLQSSTLIAPPFAMIATSLMAMGYKKTWIQSVIEQCKTTDIPTIHRILHERKEDFMKIDLENERKRYISIFSRINPSVNPTDLINSSKFDTKEQITNLSQRIFKDWTPFPSIADPKFEINFSSKWFSQTMNDLDIHSNITEWIQDKSSNANDEDNIYRLLDLNHPKHEQTIIPKSIQYSHENISSKQYFESRIACEHGLTTIYARYTILNMLKIWSNDESNLFPLEKFGDYPFLITLLKLLDSPDNEKDQIYFLIKSILKTNQSTLFYHLQKDIIIQLIEYLFKQNSSEEINLKFILKILNLFKELNLEKSFPLPLINLIFHLFLLIPIHEIKLNILHLFTSLIQIRKDFILNSQIQQFFFQLLIHLSSNTICINNQSRKKFHVALIDLIFVLLNNQNQEIQSKLPEDIQNLFTIINVIIAWNDPTKELLLPDDFLKQSNEILGENYKLNQDDFKKSNLVFNKITDQELINLMNNNNESFETFISNLPIESEPNSIFYKIYVNLSNIPADCIQIRARFIYLLNKFIEKSLPLIDFNLPPGQSILTDETRTIKLYLLFSTKFQLFNESLEKTESNPSNDWLTVNFDTVKASTDTENYENTMFYQAYQQLHTNAQTIFRQPTEQLWHAQYLGMHSTDQGGPYRDSISRICLDICSTRLPLFILCPNGRMNSGLNRDCWIPNVFPPNKSIPNKIKKQYRFIGQFMGMAIRKKHYLDLKFPILLWKRLLKEQITIEDIEAIDIQSFKIINEMEKNIDQIKLFNTDTDVENLFSNMMSEFKFDVVSSSGNTYELIPGGTDISITAENFKFYCSCYRQYRLE